MSLWDWLKPSIDRGVKKGVERAIDDFCKGPRLGEIVNEVLAKPEYKWFRFVKQMQARMMEVDKTLDGKRAWHIAATAYREFLASEKIEFGDPKYDWSRAGARDLIQDLEIDHWESAR